jgi:23S rRNA (adenine2503-C2)-methyltransferase
MLTQENKLLLTSTQDKSVNIVTKSSIGYFEARYVRRNDHTFIVYLSSQSGCDQACKFCHLTQTGQTKYINATLEDFLTQAKEVFEVYQKDLPARTVHFNFMSRGEPLNNPNVNYELLAALGALAKIYNLIPQFKISTIMPKSLVDTDLALRFAPITPDIYYSLYTMTPEHRKKWIPKGRDPEEALDILRDYQSQTGKILRLHWAGIEGVNESKEELDKIIKAVNDRKLMVIFNFVRYNSFENRMGQEIQSDILKDNLEYLLAKIPGSAGQIVSRVGIDVYASCGMFYK